MREEKKSNHRVNIVRLGEPRVHTNADTLEIFDIEGYQVVTKKGNFKGGDLAVYIQPDSVVPQTEPFKFIWGEHMVSDGLPDGSCVVPERRRRITVRRFRKEWSEGLLMPLSDFPEGLGTGHPFLGVEGDDVSDLLGITHWEGEEVEPTQSSFNESRPLRKYPRTLKGWFFFLLYKAGFKGAREQMTEDMAYDVSKFDVEALKNHKNVLLPGEQVVITEKIHGSQGRYFFKDGKMFAGSRNLWKAEQSPCVWRKALAQNPWIEEWCRAHEGDTLYGEIVPTQKGYRYGCEEGQVKFFVFDIRSEMGDFYPKNFTLSIDVPKSSIDTVPVLFTGEWQPYLLSYAEGYSQVLNAVGKREGIVITALDNTRWVRGLGRIQLKVVSNLFLEGDNK